MTLQSVLKFTGMLALGLELTLGALSVASAAERLDLLPTSCENKTHVLFVYSDLDAPGTITVSLINKKTGGESDDNIYPLTRVLRDGTLVFENETSGTRIRFSGHRGADFGKMRMTYESDVLDLNLKLKNCDIAD